MTGSSRTPLIAGNWKMHTDRAGAIALANAVHEGAATHAGSVDLAVIPPFVYLDAVGQAIGADGVPRIALGAQDVSDAPNGALTGEISVEMLRDLQVRFVLTGHSERRHVIGESDELVARKTSAVLDAGLECILCIGETIEQRRAGDTDVVNQRQLRAALEHIDLGALERLTIAYEPVWAIGTGLAATPDDAQDAHAKIRALVGDGYGSKLGQSIRILYGGSVKPENAADLLSQPDVDGGLIGGASLDADSFLGIAAAATALRA